MSVKDVLGIVAIVFVATLLPFSIGFGAYMTFIVWWSSLPTNGLLMLAAILWFIINIIFFIGCGLIITIGEMQGGASGGAYFLMGYFIVVGILSFALPYYFSVFQ